MRFLKKTSLFFLLLFLGFSIQGQEFLRDRDLSKVKVDILTDDDILKVKQQLTQQNITIDQARPLLLSRGLSSQEYSKLKIRLQNTTASKKANTTKSNFDYRDVNQNKTRLSQAGNRIGGFSNLMDTSFATDFQLIQPWIDPKIFGSELFNRNEYGFPEIESDAINVATPQNYTIGVGDILELVVYGQQEFSDQLQVNRDGAVFIENVGVVALNGLTIETALIKLKKTMQRAYPTLLSGTSRLNLSLSEVRSIQVTVLGANRSGTVTLPSLANVFMALSKAGGPTNNGSFRKIELVRNNKVVAILDLYKLLLKGDQSTNLILKDNDVIRIPTYDTRIELSGQVKRPGIYEVLQNETFKDVLVFSGGFDDTAYSASVKVIRKTAKEKELKDLSSTDYSTFKPVSGDLFLISKILNRFHNRLKISGSVYRPDYYELVPGMKVADLISSADGLTDDAFMGRALLVRTKEDMTKEMKSIDLSKAMINDGAHNIQLKKEDELIVTSILDLKDSLKLTLQGEVHLPGEYTFIEGMTLKSLILSAGGFTNASSSNIEVAHLLARERVNENDLRSSLIENIVLKDTLSFSDLDIPLQPFDVVTVRRKASYDKIETVVVSGQVQFPGPYALNTSNERVSDLYGRVGGLLPNAHIQGAYLKRFKTPEERQRIAEDAKRLQKQIADASAETLKDVEKEFDKIPLDLAAILKNPGTTIDVILKAKDELIIPKMDAQVRVSGSVLQSTQIPYETGKRFKYYISSAGGYSRDAWKKRSYVVYANGRAETTKKFLIFRSHPLVQPGAEIIVPMEPPAKKRVTTVELIGLSSAIASLAGVVIALLRL